MSGVAGGGDARALLATGFVADGEGEGSLFPSSGGSSGSQAVQAVYWRCIAVLMFSARLTNPQLRLALFTNVVPPPIDGFDLAELFARLGVEVVRLPLTHRLEPARARSWGNVFYVLDIVAHLARTAPDTRLALVDSDVVVTQPVGALFDRIAAVGYVGYVVDTAPDADVNGMSRRDMTAAVAARGGAGSDLPRHYGGELLGIDLAAARPHLPAIDALWADAAAARNGAGGIRTEEHFWSIWFAAQHIVPAGADGLLKRLWTSPRFNTVAPGDERLPLWHLPAEKRYGLADLFEWAARRDFDLATPPDLLRAQAGQACGVPAKTLAKRWRDGVRQVRARLRRCT